MGRASTTNGETHLFVIACDVFTSVFYIMRKSGLDKSQTGIKIAGRSINSLRYADDTNLMAESEEELRNLLMRVKEENAKNGLKLNIKKTNIMATGPITSWQIEGATQSLHPLFLFLLHP